MKTKIFSVFLFITMITLFMSCSKYSYNYNATLVNYTGLDGCGWVVKMIDGTIYEPLNLKDFEPNPVNNEPVCISFSESPAMSICMVGKTIRINSLKK